MLSKSKKYLTLSAFAVAANTTFASELHCNHRQTTCAIEDKYLTIGDHVGIFNADHDLVAIGEVKSMSGERRTIALEKVTGKITKASTVNLIKEDQSSGGSYSLFHELPSTTVGASVGVANVAAGNGPSGILAEGFSEWREYKYFHLVLRGMYFQTSGRVSRPDNINNGIESENFQMHAFGLVPALATTLFPTEAASLRFEVGAGYSYQMTSLQTQDGASMQDYDPHLSNGSGLLTEARTALLLNTFGTYHPELEGGIAQFSQTTVSSVTLGLLKDLD